MITFLIGLSIGALIVIAGILLYQHRHAYLHIDEKGTLIDVGHDPLSKDNIHKMATMLHHFIKAEIKMLLVFTLKFLLKLRKVSRVLLDRGISKVAHMVFKETVHTGIIEENNILYHVEEHKKTAEKGQIHL